MFGNMFSGLFGKPDMQNVPDALGQASMGAPTAMGQGMPQNKSNGMDRQKLAMMLMQGMRGFNMGTGGYGSAQPQQFRDFYRPMTGPQQSVMFDPRVR